MPPNEPWLLRSVEVGTDLVDCRIAEGRVVDVAAGLDPLPGEGVVDGAGGALLPGLADHHVHVLAMAAARASIDLAGATDLDHAPAPEGSGWLRVVGAGSELTRHDIDRHWGDRPVRVQHRSGALWTLSTAAVEVLAKGLAETERESGQLWRADRRLGHLLAEVDDGLDAHLADVGRDLAARGVTHLTDATPDLDARGLERIVSAVPQHVLSMAESGGGPRKIVLPDHTAIDFDEFRATVRACHGQGRPVAVHAVTATALAVAIAAFDEVGTLSGDRIEHAAICEDAAAERLAELGLTVVTQPTVFARHGAKFRQESAPAERPALWRHAGLLARGIRVVVSSDAPYGDPDPARTLHACATRPDEGVRADVVLESYLLEPNRLEAAVRTVAPGAEASLCLLEVPIRHALAAVETGGSLGVRATFISGKCVYARDFKSL
ncbi:amidohydrolase family protein [Aeromicrobium ginsengisoli]|uniref:Amidohydrolase family protein n=1 Tax=Aeromicrobium ginsengisoli TaxID=363867 RepID=A0A5M4FAQ9_9ACTN|nr:amidohydrolase family protein [Aeromicrobium ginsengisoli]KAA1394301.1 amidohydrolase family protein [Aeromicrobium ginsengisoli]